MITTTRGGPPSCEIHRRVIRSLATGRVIDDCLIDDVPDHALHRPLRQPEDIRVELIMKNAVKMFERKGADVSEIYSQPRIVQEAALGTYGSRRLKPGWSLDLTRDDPATGEPWDLSRHEVRERVRKLVRETKPFMLIGSPPCTMFSSLQNLAKARRDKKKTEKLMNIAKEHIEFCIELYMIQVENGRYFLHEHP